MHLSRALLVAVTLALLLPACTGAPSAGADDVAAPAAGHGLGDTPVSDAPVSDAPDADAPDADAPDADVPTEDVPDDPGPGGDEPLPAIPPLVGDWDGSFELALPNGWTIRGCDGDAPLVCFHDGSRQVGFLELGRFPLPEDHDGAAAAYLEANLRDFLTSMEQDRAAGCPDLAFEPSPAVDAVVGGLPGLRSGFRMVDADGVEVERHVVYWTVHAGEHVVVTAAGYGEGGCLASMGEFAPEDLGLVTREIDRFVADTPLPVG